MSKIADSNVEATSGIREDTSPSPSAKATMQSKDSKMSSTGAALSKHNSAELAKFDPAVTKLRKPQTLEFETKSGNGTIALGRKLAELLTPPRVMILSGDLGAGKTTLVKGIAAAVGAAEADEVTSPTFTLVHEYSGSLDGNTVKLLHLDLYRLDTERQLEPLGLEEMQTPDAVILIEWGEKFKSIRKRADGEISITSIGGDSRKITLTLN